MHLQHFTIHISVRGRQRVFFISTITPSLFLFFVFFVVVFLNRFCRCESGHQRWFQKRIFKHFSFLQWRKGLHKGHDISSSSPWTWQWVEAINRLFFWGFFHVWSSDCGEDVRVFLIVGQTGEGIDCSKFGSRVKGWVWNELTCPGFHTELIQM